MKKTILLIFLLICAASTRAATNVVPVKIAIVPESPAAAEAADMLMAEMSKNDSVQLVERAEIEKVYREQGLSAGNQDYIKLGQMLGADGLLALQPVTVGTNRYLSAQLVAVRPGVILEDRRVGWPTIDAARWADVLVHHLDPLLPKLTVLPQDAIPISVVNFHAGVRSTTAAELEQQIFFLTVERLVREKRLFVLERKRMQSLSEEKDLANQEADPFWSGKYLLDGAIDRDGFDPNTVTINARLIPPGGSPILIEAKGSRTNCTEAVNQFAEKVLAALKIDARPAAWNTADEADRFFKEAQWNLAWKIFPQARQAAAAAWALGKQDSEARILRVRTFMPPPDSGIIYFPPQEKPTPEKIDDALHALRLYRMFSQDLPLNEPKPDSAWYQLGMDNLCIATRVLQQFNWSPEFYQPFTEKLTELRVEARAMAELLSRAPSVHEGYFVGSRRVKYDDLYHFMEKPSIYGLKVEGGCLWQEKPEDTLALYRELMSSPVFRYLHERLWFRTGDSICSLPRLPDRLVAWNKTDQERIPKVWRDFVEELKNSPEVLPQMEARALRLADVRFSVSNAFDSRVAYETANRAANKLYEEEMASAFADFCDAFVANRIYYKTNNVDVLYLNWGVDKLLGRVGGDTAITFSKRESLQQQYRTEYTAKLAAKDQELSGFLAARAEASRAEDSKMKNLQLFEGQKAFLKASQPFDIGAFSQMFSGFKDYSPEQALEIKPLLAEYKKQLSGNMAFLGEREVGGIEANVERILNPATVATSSPNRVARTNGNPVRPPGVNFPPGAAPHFAPNRPPPNREAEPLAEAPAPEPLVSSNIVPVKSFYPLPIDGLPGGEPNTFSFIGHQWVEGKLLLDFRYNAWVYASDKDGNWNSSASKVFVGMAIFDPATKGWTLAALPESFNEPVFLPARPSVLWHGDLFSSHTGKIRKFDFQKRIWESAEFPMEGGSFCNLNGRLFIADNNSIQEIVENGRNTKLLASIQRQPPVTSLDSQGALMNLALFTDAQNCLCAAVHNKVFRWDGMDWREIGAAPASFAPSVFDNGVLFLTDGWNTRPARISCFGARSNLIETCLLPPALPPNRGGYAPRPVPGGDLPKPLWKLPAELSLPNLSAAYWQSDLVLMTDHSEKQDIVAETHGTRPDGTLETSRVITGSKFASKEGYNASLLCFSRDLAAAHKVRLNFESDSFPPMAGLGSNQQPLSASLGFTKPWMLFTSNFLFCGRERVGNNLGNSEPANFKPGIWAVPLETISREIAPLKQIQTEQQKVIAQKKFDEQRLDEQKRRAFLQKFDQNHNDVIDPEEQSAASEDPYFIKYRR